MTALNSEGLEKIKLCPLCRHVAREADPVHSTEGQIDSGYGPLSFGVECGADLECGCKVDGFPDQSSAIAAWNRRALPPVDGLEVVGYDDCGQSLNYSHCYPDNIRSDPASSGLIPLVTLSQASSVIAGLTAERDEARAEVERMTPKFVAYDYLESPAGREAAEARISSLEEENKRLREALEAAKVWHEAEDKALSKQPPSSGPNGNAWARLQHQEQMREIETALLPTTEDNNG